MPSLANRMEAIFVTGTTYATRSLSGSASAFTGAISKIAAVAAPTRDFTKGMPALVIIASILIDHPMRKSPQCQQPDRLRRARNRARIGSRSTDMPGSTNPDLAGPTPAGWRSADRSTTIGLELDSLYRPARGRKGSPPRSRERTERHEICACRRHLSASDGLPGNVFRHRGDALSV